MPNYYLTHAGSRQGPYRIGDAIRLHDYTPSAVITDAETGEKLTLNQLKEKFTLYDVYREIGFVLGVKNDPAPKEPKAISLFEVRRSTNYPEARRLTQLLFWGLVAMYGVNLVLVVGLTLGFAAQAHMLGITDWKWGVWLAVALIFEAALALLTWWLYKLMAYGTTAFFDVVDRVLMRKEP